MELVEELKDIKTIIWVLTGNGPTEHRILKGAARKYDGSKKVLFLPKRPGFQYGSGLSVLRVTKTYVGKYNAKKFFCLIDREHIKTDYAEEFIESKLREFGVEVINVQRVPVDGEEVLRIEGKVGAHEFILWVAVSGIEKCIEEDVTKLLKTEFEESVEPTKDSIKSALRRHNIDLDQLINNASVNKFKCSFPAIHAVLSYLEADKQ